MQQFNTYHEKKFRLILLGNNALWDRSTEVPEKKNVINWCSTITILMDSLTKEINSIVPMWEHTTLPDIKYRNSMDSRFMVVNYTEDKIHVVSLYE